MIALLKVHPTRPVSLRDPDLILTEPNIPIELYTDSFGNHCARFVAPAGWLRLYSANLLDTPGDPDPVDLSAEQHPVEKLPVDTLRYLLASRYCPVDQMVHIASDLFGHTQPGWERVQAISTWVHQHVTFGYHFARATKTALDVYLERNGVCRDYQHLAVTFCRAMNIPARYAAGYLGDIRVPVIPGPMDFSAWFEVYLGDRWWPFDARFNTPRIGRTPMAFGRDATDVAITTSFGTANLRSFLVVTEEISEQEANC